MGVATGCGCKEVYRLPHTTYPYSSCVCSFLQQHPYFLFIFFFSFSFFFQYFFVITFYVLNNFFTQYKHIPATTGVPQHPYEGCTDCFIHEQAHTNVRFLSCDGHQLYERGVDLEVEGVRYIEMHRGPAAYLLGPPPSRGRDLELEGGVNACHVEYVSSPGTPTCEEPSNGVVGISLITACLYCRNFDLDYIGPVTQKPLAHCTAR